MKVSVTKDHDLCIITPEGRIDTLAAPELEKAVKENVPEHDRMILDFKGVDYIASAGLRAIAYAHREMAKKGGLVVRGLNQNLETIIRMTGFDKILHIEK